MATNGGGAPIIIKKVQGGGGGHHGGAWKVAYADFVTAMMAFFLLMWLLGSTAKGDLVGISEYFKTPLKVAMQVLLRRPRFASPLPWVQRVATILAYVALVATLWSFLPVVSTSLCL